jgi:acylphosphatase
VEALFSGEETNIDQMIAACHVGPPAARVDKVLVDPDDREVPPGFSVLAIE